MISEITDSAIIDIFAHDCTGSVSVGLNAVAFVNDKVEVVGIGRASIPPCQLGHRVLGETEARRDLGAGGALGGPASIESPSTTG